MSKLNHKLISIIFATATIILFSDAIISVAQTQSVPNYNFTRDFTVGSRGDDVRALQQFLNSHGFQVSASGPGSPGNESIYFGRATKEALAQWQATNGILPATGYFGLKSRLVISAIIGGPTLKPLELIPGTSGGEVSPEWSASSVGKPTRLKIPSINVNTIIEYVGLTPNGAMDVPKSPHNVGWFKLGSRPGENGTAVIDGHFGFKKGSVFDNLYKLRKGDELYVQDEKGKITTFVVREILKYDSKADASDVFGSNEGPSHLNLITCEGIWDKVSRNYSKRLVIFTDKE